MGYRSDQDKKPVRYGLLPPGKLPASALLLFMFALASLQGANNLAAKPESPEYETISRGPVVVRYDPSRQKTALEVLRIAPGSIERLSSELGMKSAQGPIRIELPAFGKEPRRRGKLPSWVAGYAISRKGTIVLVQGREPGYPYRSIRSLVEHELTHVLLYRAVMGRPIPKWFNEGIAMYEAREWVLADSYHTWVGMIFAGEIHLSRVSQMFGEGESRTRTAYALSYSFIRFLTERSGPDVLRRIIHHIASGMNFHSAFREATGESVLVLEQRWRKRTELTYKWIPVVTSTTTLWLVITTLSLVVFLRKRQENRRLLEQWEEEEEDGGPGSFVM